MGFIPSRQLGDNVRRTLNIFLYLQDHKTESEALSVDLEKAFDSVNIHFLQVIVQQISFGEKFRNAIAAIYSTPSVKLKVNDLFSESVPLQ